jgi:hypothetical protein
MLCDVYTASYLTSCVKHQRKNTRDIRENQTPLITPYSKDITQPTATHIKTHTHTNTNIKTKVIQQYGQGHKIHPFVTKRPESDSCSK